MGTKVDYLEKRGQSAEYCGVVTDLITRSGPSTRTNIDDALAPYLPAAQRRNWDDGPLRASDMREEGAALAFCMVQKRENSIVFPAK